MELCDKMLKYAVHKLTYGELYGMSWKFRYLAKVNITVAYIKTSNGKHDSWGKKARAEQQMRT